MSSSQCQAQTQKGAQCSRKPCDQSSKYCTQHLKTVKPKSKATPKITVKPKSKATSKKSRGPTPYAYKFRAESQIDVDRFKTLAEDIIATITETPDPQFPDVDVDMTTHTSLSLEDIRKLMRPIPDSHVMVESLNTSQNYTGERWYDDDDEDTP